jgi:hypothetical protein
MSVVMECRWLSNCGINTTLLPALHHTHHTTPHHTTYTATMHCTALHCHYTAHCTALPTPPTCHNLCSLPQPVIV